MNWLPDVLPSRAEVDGLLFVPLTPALVVDDHAALMRDIGALRAWSGQDWPTADFTVQDNLVDLERHDREQRDGIALTYSVLLDGRIEGCTYVRPFVDALRTRDLPVPTPLAAPATDVVVRGWMHRCSAEVFLRAVLSFFGSAPFAFPRLWWQTNERCPDQVRACDALGLVEEVVVEGVDRRWLLRSRPVAPSAARVSR